MTNPTPLNPDRDWQPWELVARELDPRFAESGLQPGNRMILAGPACQRIVAAEERLAEAVELIRAITKASTALEGVGICMDCESFLAKLDRGEED